MHKGLEVAKKYLLKRFVSIIEDCINFNIYFYIV